MYLSSTSTIYGFEGSFLIAKWDARSCLKEIPPGYCVILAPTILDLSTKRYYGKGCGWTALLGYPDKQFNLILECFAFD